MVQFNLMTRIADNFPKRRSDRQLVSLLEGFAENESEVDKVALAATTLQLTDCPDPSR